MNNEQAEFYLRAGRTILFPVEADEHLAWMATKAEEAAKARDKAQKGSFLAMIYEAEVIRLGNGIVTVRRALDAITNQDDADAGVRPEAAQSDQPVDGPGDDGEHGRDDLEEAGERPGIRHTIERVDRDTTGWLQDARKEHPGW